jgi:hypothetical protein
LETRNPRPWLRRAGARRAVERAHPDLVGEGEPVEIDRVVFVDERADAVEHRLARQQPVALDHPEGGDDLQLDAARTLNIPKLSFTARMVSAPTVASTAGVAHPSP